MAKTSFLGEIEIVVGRSLIHIKVRKRSLRFKKNEKRREKSIKEFLRK